MVSEVYGVIRLYLHELYYLIIKNRMITWSDEFMNHKTVIAKLFNVLLNQTWYNIRAEDGVREGAGLMTEL